MAECLGEELGCRIVRGVSPSTWRVNFIGSQKRGTKRATLKDLTKERCRQLGMKPQNDDEADAIGILTRSEEHTSELQSLMRISYAVFCLKKKKHKTTT